MAHRTLLTAGLLLGGLGLAPAALAGSSTYQSAISEVDACNQAQYLMPAKATVQGFVLKTRTDSKGVTRFDCRVNWTDQANAQPTDRPILFPSKVRQPWFAAGWL
ncbi:MAG: hypothetical protein EB136_01875 [Synechococcaceae bacterium WBB_3_034]|jgi:hypothetical protein|nr:hypothetical protein [Synechococcaceae bacterium WBB_3_034]NDG22277.1 hypothetical protein [Synechococcaceae bacterium WBB_10_009]